MATGERLIELFRQLDRTETTELGRVLEALDELTWTDERLDQILREADANRDGKIQYGEFVRWLFSDGGGQACTGGQDLSKGLRFQVEALVGLRELAAVPADERREQSFDSPGCDASKVCDAIRLPTSFQSNGSNEPWLPAMAAWQEKGLGHVLVFAEQDRSGVRKPWAETVAADLLDGSYPNDRGGLGVRSLGVPPRNGYSAVFTEHDLGCGLGFFWLLDMH
eukprot:Skav204553  [mRNA]  locus=scaffold3346:177817:182031:- [translate_table: standard]